MRNPYGVSKKCCELIIQNYCELFSFSAIFARIANVYGEGNLEHRFIEKTIKQVKNNEDIELFGGEEKVLNFVYVDDCVQRLIDFGNIVVQSSPGFDRLDIASDHSWKLSSLASLIISEAGQDRFTGKVVYRPNRWGETLRYTPKSGDLLLPDRTAENVRRLCSLS